MNHSIEGSLDLMKNGKVDAVAAWEPYPLVSTSKNETKILIDGDKSGIDYIDGVVVNRNWAKENPDYLKAFLQGLKEAHHITKTDPERAALIFSKESGYPLDVCKKLVSSIHFEAQMSPRDIETLKGSLQFLQSLNKIKKMNLAKFIFQIPSNTN